MAKPCVYYFPIRGRAEPIRIALAAAGVDFEEKAVDYEEMKSDLALYPFAQCPRYVDAEGDLSQSNTIMRHLGRKHGLMGSGLSDAGRIDMLIDGVEDIKRKYLTLIYQDQLSDEAKAAHWATHVDPASATKARNGGAHFAYLAGLVDRYGAGGWAVGGALSIADILVADIFDLHQRVYGQQLRGAYPQLAALHDKVAEVPGVKSYLASPRRLEKVNNNGLG